MISAPKEQPWLLPDDTPDRISIDEAIPQLFLLLFLYQVTDTITSLLSGLLVSIV